MSTPPLPTIAEMWRHLVAATALDARVNASESRVIQAGFYCGVAKGLRAAQMAAQLPAEQQREYLLALSYEVAQADAEAEREYGGRPFS